LPEYEAGISKLKMEQVDLSTLPLYDVPAALSGEVESTGMMRWGY
jgi:hypothetical protein